MALYGPAQASALTAASPSPGAWTGLKTGFQVPRSALGVVPAVTAPEPELVPVPVPVPVMEPPPLLPPGEDEGGDMLLPEQPECPPRATLPVCVRLTPGEKMGGLA